MFDPSKLDRLIADRGWRDAELAKRAGMSPQQWHAIASGKKRDPTIWTVQRVAKAVRCCISDLVNEDPPAPRKGSKRAAQQRKRGRKAVQ